MTKVVREKTAQAEVNVSPNRCVLDEFALSQQRRERSGHGKRQIKRASEHACVGTVAQRRWMREASSTTVAHPHEWVRCTAQLRS